MAKRLWHGRADTSTVAELLPQIRACDAAEVWAADGDLIRGCVNALNLTPDAIAMRDREGGLIAIYGAAPVALLGSRQAAPWLLGTERMHSNAVGVFHDMRLFIRHLSEHYDHLLNYVDARNVGSIAWLARLGFSIGEAQPRGPHRMLFHPFEMDLSDV